MCRTGQGKSGLLNRKYQLDLQPAGGGGLAHKEKEKVGKLCLSMRKCWKMIIKGKNFVKGIGKNMTARKRREKIEYECGKILYCKSNGKKGGKVYWKKKML